MSKIVSLQVLRGFAATVVAGFHLQAAAINEGFSPGLFRVFAGGEIGVDVFFVISGFIIFYVSQRRSDMTRRAFLQARFWRIFPPYWAILTLYVLAALTMTIVLGDNSNLPDTVSLVISYLLLPYPDHVIIIAWTLSIEILFYAVFAAAYFGGGTRRLILSMLVWVIATQFFMHFVDDKPTWLLLPMNTAVLEFLFGVLIAVYYSSVPKGGTRFHIPAFVLGGGLVVMYLATGGWLVEPFGREIAAGVPAALLVYGILGFAWKGLDTLDTWGESSYGLYLFHILYFSIVGKAVEISSGINVYASQVYMLCMLISVVVICCFATIYLERPYQKWYRKFLGTRPVIPT